jgi:hypothetical protein
MIAPPRKTVERLAAVCARLASDFEGERAVAGLLATRMLNDLGMDWNGLIERAFSPRASAPRPARFTYAPTDEETALDVYRELLAQDWLNDWERKFVGDLLAKEAVALSAKQQNCLRKILNKYRAAAKEERHHAAA